MIPLIDIRREIQAVQEQILKDIEDVLASGQYILGPKVKELENELQKTLDVADVVTVANGTDALVLSLEAFEIGPGDEVITTPFTFFATAEAIARVGARPVFVDVDRRTYNIDPRKIEAALTPRTKAIIPVHLFGQPADMDPIMEIARQYHLWVIEDACQAFGATYKNRPAGGLADAACFSFFPTKNLGTMGDGGCVTLADSERGKRIRQLRHHGSDRKYYHQTIGYNSRLDEIHAAILLTLLEYIPSWNEQRRYLADRYRNKLGTFGDTGTEGMGRGSTVAVGTERIRKGRDGIRVRPEARYAKHVYHLFCVEVGEREKVMEQLRRNNIGCGVYYPCPLHLQQAFASLGYRTGDFPVAEALANLLLALPLGPFLKESEQDEVIETISKTGKEHC